MSSFSCSVARVQKNEEGTMGKGGVRQGLAARVSASPGGESCARGPCHLGNGGTMVSHSLAAPPGRVVSASGQACAYILCLK